MYDATLNHGADSAGPFVFPVENDDALGRLIALFLHDKLFGRPQQRQGRCLTQLGWEESLVDEISSMPIHDVVKVLGGPNACVGVVFDHRKAAALLNSYRAIQRDDRELDFFILNGATPVLIRKLFPAVNARVVAQRRKRLGCDTRGGRPPLPDDDTCHEVYRCWESLTSQVSNLRTRFLRLKEQFPMLSFATLAATVDPD